MERARTSPQWPVRLVAPALGAGALSALYLVDPSERTVFFPCPFRLLTGLDCPLCGGLRMVHSALHTDFAAAADFNLFALVTIPVLVMGWLLWRVRRRSGNAGPPRWLPVTMAVLLLTWTVVRNLPVEPFTILRS